MSVDYLDTSALAKLVVTEEGSQKLRTRLEGRDLVASALVRTELLRAVGRHEHDLGPAYDVLRAVSLVALDDDLLDAAGLLPPVVLRSLDAIHLASALALGVEEVDAVITYDRHMAAAATALGFVVEAPGTDDR